MTDELTEPFHLGVSSGYGVKFRRPMVRLTLGEQEVDIQITDAFSLSTSIALAAAAALAESVVVEMSGGESLTTEEVADVLKRLREARERVDETEQTTDL